MWMTCSSTMFRTFPIISDPFCFLLYAEYCLPIAKMVFQTRSVFIEKRFCLPAFSVGRQNLFFYTVFMIAGVYSRSIFSFKTTQPARSPMTLTQVAPISHSVLMLM